AAALADDLKRFLDGQPVKARQILLPHRWLRAIKRNQLISTLAVISLSSIMIAVATVLASLQIIQEQKMNAEQLINRIQAANARRYEKAIRKAEDDSQPDAPLVGEPDERFREAVEEPSDAP
ncbi:MAG: hypothetical protein AAGF97_09885, partial [Planctomycetota bacterium]